MAFIILHFFFSQYRICSTCQRLRGSQREYQGRLPVAFRVPQPPRNQNLSSFTREKKKNEFLCTTNGSIPSTPEDTNFFCHQKATNHRALVSTGLTRFTRERKRNNNNNNNINDSRKVHQKYSCLQVDALISDGQYGHLKDFVLFFDIFMIDCLQRTCPHVINIGGFSSVDCSFDTGHTKMEWN